MKSLVRAAIFGAASAALALSVQAQTKPAAKGAAGDTIKVAYIDPLSGPFANVGEQGLAEFRFAVNRINASGGVLGGRKLEVIGFDNKVSPQESLNQLKRVIDQGIQYITQGNSSAVAGALIEAVNRHNERNPGKEILYPLALVVIGGLIDSTLMDQIVTPAAFKLFGRRVYIPPESSLEDQR